jgi:hypothetical protein
MAKKNADRPAATETLSPSSAAKHKLCDMDPPATCVCVYVQANFSTERWCPFIVPGKRATHASRKMLHAGKLRPFIVADCCCGGFSLVKFAPA